MAAMPMTIINQPDRHAFVMLGTKPIFLCHLTMFHMEEHMYQLVLQVRVPDYGMRQYQYERKWYPQTTYFLGNSENDLMTVAELQAGTRDGFIADIFRGIPLKNKYLEWPWKGVQPTIRHLPVTIERIVYYRHFDFKLDYPQCLTYVLFGSGEEAHLTHYQTKEPDFDQVLSLVEAPSWLPPRQLEAGVHVNIPDLPSRPASAKTYCSNPLTAATYDVMYAGYVSVGQIKIGYNHWCSTKIVNTVDPCMKPGPGKRVVTRVTPRPWWRP